MIGFSTNVRPFNELYDSNPPNETKQNMPFTSDNVKLKKKKKNLRQSSLFMHCSKKNKKSISTRKMEGEEATECWSKRTFPAASAITKSKKTLVRGLHHRCCWSPLLFLQHFYKSPPPTHTHTRYNCVHM